ncbi:hypothetical protein GALL_447440 [mine drainage metagenome]|uniref:Uncharacterized protein n=1 Tax=mine drainage metagenome TaxID=410659 RepID=A0A1J5PPV6_9ZZZZ
MITQQGRCSVQVPLAGVLQMQAHQIDHAHQCALKLRAQKFTAKVTRNLHHALGCLLRNGTELGLGDQPVLHSILQGLFKERTLVDQ